MIKKTIDGVRFIISKKIGNGEIIYENNSKNIKTKF